MTVREWIAEHAGSAVTVDADTTPDQFAARMFDELGVRDLFVVDKQRRIIGHISHTRLARLLLAQHRPAHTRREIIERVTHGPASEFMDRHFVFAQPDEQLDDVVTRMLDHRIEDLPVIDADGAVLGAVNMRLLLQSYADELRTAATPPECDDATDKQTS